jgi:hypothetical protein
MLKKTIAVRKPTPEEALDYDTEAGKIVDAIFAIPQPDRVEANPEFRKLRQKLTDLESRMGIIWLPGGLIRKIVV